MVQQATLDEKLEIMTFEEFDELSDKAGINLIQELKKSHSTARACLQCFGSLPLDSDTYQNFSNDDYFKRLDSNSKILFLGLRGYQGQKVSPEICEVLSYNDVDSNINFLTERIVNGDAEFNKGVFEVTHNNEVLKLYVHGETINLEVETPTRVEVTSFVKGENIHDSYVKIGPRVAHTKPFSKELQYKPFSFVTPVHST